MKYLLFSNPGQLTLNNLHLIGETPKRNDNRFIGDYGSGLKLSAPLIKRLGLDIQIYSGLHKFDIQWQPIDGTTSENEQMVIDGVQTSITKNAFPGWKTWYIVREFFANMLDAGGKEMHLVEDIIPYEGEVKVYLQMNDELHQIYNDWYIKYYIGETKVIRNYNPTLFLAYRDGFLIAEKKIQDNYYPFFFNTQHFKINEIREAANDVAWEGQYHGFKWISGDDYKHFIDLVILHGDKVKYYLNYNGDAWWELMAQYLNSMGKKIYPQIDMAIKALSGNLRGEDFSAITLPSDLYIHLIKYGLNTDVQMNSFGLINLFNEQEAKMINHCRNTFEKLGIYDLPEIVKMVYMQGSILGSWDKDAQQIGISYKVLEKGNDMCTHGGIMKILWEEYHHFKSGFGDDQNFITYALNNWLMCEADKNDIFL